jgi:glycyl-tRNA synthetase
MASELEQQIEVAQAAVSKQGDSVRALKALVKDGKAEKVA